jgi:rhodanese-related sulfurtransferase
MKKLLVLFVVLLLALPALSVAAQEDAVSARLLEFGNNLPEGYGLIGVEDLNALLAEQDVILLDVRQPDEYAAGHLEGSFNVPLREVTQNLNLLPDTDATIVVICKVGGRSMLASTVLQLLGYQNIKVLSGGFDAWAAADMPSVPEAFVPEVGEAPEFDAAVFEAADAYLTNLPEGFGMVSATNLAAELVENPLILIDVRSDNEWNQGYIEGAQHIWINEFMSRVDELPADKDAPIVVYCGAGYRGGIAAVLMNLLGYTNVRNLSGGTGAWVAAELPLVGVPETVVEEAPFDLQAYLADYTAALPDTFGAIRVNDLAAELEANPDLFLVDVRTADEYAEGFIEGAINIPISELTQHLDLLPAKDAPIVVVCGSGHRSAVAMTALNLLGYTNVRSMLSGMNAWTAAELPVSQTPVEAVAGAAPELDPAVFEPVNGFISTIPAGYYTVRPADLGAELIENPPLLIDVRTDGEWADGHIEGAVHLPLRDLLTTPDLLPEDLAAAIVVYDNPTHRSSMAMTFLRLLGYENVRALGGGVGAWTNAGQALVTE